jgi:hypothetical protein
LYIISSIKNIVSLRFNDHIYIITGEITGYVCIIVFIVVLDSLIHTETCAQMLPNRNLSKNPAAGSANFLCE